MPQPETPRQHIIDRLTPRYGPGEAASIARIVLEDAFGSRYVELDVAGRQQLDTILKRLEAGEPVQYVLGRADFFGFKFRVDPSVLIPRQETEELVAWVLEILRSSGLPKPTLLDVGLGSGCIGIALKAKFPALRLWGLEKSPAACRLANENARQLLPMAEFNFLEGDVLDRAGWTALPNLDFLVSNPPYIPEHERGLMPPHVHEHEPALALFVPDGDPLLFYRVIAELALEKLRPGGQLFFECNEFNAGQVVDLLREKGFVPVELRRDLAGAERMVRAGLPSHLGG